MRISHEAIYQALYVQSRGALKRELVACLRTGRALRVPRTRGKTFVTNEVMISQRPAEAADRAVPRPLGGRPDPRDRSLGDRHARRAHRRFVMLLHLPPTGDRDAPKIKNGPPVTGRGAEGVRDAITAAIGDLPEQLRRSLTWDQAPRCPSTPGCGSTPAFRCTSVTRRAPWQRGTNENTNGLLRQYFPKGTDLARHSPGDLAAVAAALNTRPRKTLGWRTPAEVLDEFLASAA